MKSSLDIFWFRRDLRIEDNAGLYHALRSDKPVLPIFIFDTQILDKLEDKNDARVDFIYQTVTNLNEKFQAFGSALHIYFGNPIEVWKDILTQYNIDKVYTNRDYEQYAILRDEQVATMLKEKNTTFQTYKDQIIFEKHEVLKDDGDPYVVFTPYKRKWLAKLLTKGEDYKNSYYFKSYPSEKYTSNLFQTKPKKIPTLSSMGFASAGITFPSTKVNQKTIKAYDKNRDYPAIDGTSMLGIHFRFGTISIREKARKAITLNETYLSELVWRDFYAQILAHFPKVEQNAFRDKYERIPWRNNESEFECWCQGKTGYPIVDAGMRQLNETGYMHNRVRMVVASFLTKHLLIDWRWGEAYFAKKLLDFDLASNNGGWQWAAGCGTDAAPYFRIFNPESQQKKFDKEFKYIKKWVPEYGTEAYISPIVDHKMARERCLSTYKSALNT